LLSPCTTTISIIIAINTTTTTTITTNDPFYTYFPIPLATLILIVKVTTTITLLRNLIRRKGKAPNRIGETISSLRGILVGLLGRPFTLSKIFSSSSIVAP
jgi:hypothetical protein